MVLCTSTLSLSFLRNITPVIHVLIKEKVCENKNLTRFPVRRTRHTTSCQLHHSLCVNKGQNENCHVPSQFPVYLVMNTRWCNPSNVHNKSVKCQCENSKPPFCSGGYVSLWFVCGYITLKLNIQNSLRTRNRQKL